MNDTPRTDSEVFLLFKTGEDEGVTAEFARKLERENAALRAEIDSLKSALEALAISSMNREEPL